MTKAEELMAWWDVTGNPARRSRQILGPTLPVQRLSAHRGRNPRLAQGLQRQLRTAWSDKELAHRAKDAAKAKHEKPRGYLLDGSIADQRPEPDWTLPTKPHASGKIPTTLTTVNSNLRARAHNMDSQSRGYTQLSRVRVSQKIT